MSLIVEFDPHGYPRTDFITLRGHLLAAGKKFGERELRQLPFDQLHMAAMANAGQAACSVEDVIAEKKARRYRFLMLPQDELRKSESYLRSEDMWDNLQSVIRMRDALHWDDLSPVARLWCVLNCLHNHIDLPEERIRQAVVLLAEAEATKWLSSDVARQYQLRLDRLYWDYPTLIDDDTFRIHVGLLAEEMLAHMDDTDKSVCQQDLIVEYSCTSDCYHPVE